MLIFYIKSFIIFLFLLFIVSCNNPIDTKQKMMKSIPKNKKQSDTQKFGAWIFSKESKHCYIYSFPVSSYGSYLERKIHYLQVNDKKELSVLGGLSFKEGSKVRIDLASYTFFLEIVGNNAWTNNDDFIISKFLDNKDSIFFVYNEFKAVNDKDQSAVDKYTLQGFLEAWEYMTINCNVRPLVNQKLDQG